MKRTFSVILVLLSVWGYTQVPAYYSGIDFTLNGTALKNALANRISTTHTPITYAQCWDVLKLSDLEPGSSTDVLLVYGYIDDADPVTDRTRNKDLNGGLPGEWNREHVFPKSLGVPDLGSSGPGSDAHNLRASDVQQNGNRGNRFYATGSGNAGNVGADWYPGDEWKGDCARIIMYMYLRYGTQCLPVNCVSGVVNGTDANMIDLLLDWNVEDPVSTHEEDRNDGIYATQNNRNPFIDNPYLATKIWGGTPAEDPWGGVGLEDEEFVTLKIYPNPSFDGNIYLSTPTIGLIGAASLFKSDGKLYKELNVEWIETPSRFCCLPRGSYILRVQTIYGREIVRKFSVLGAE